MNTALLKNIIKSSQNKSLVFFVGAGVSQLSGAPSWKKLIIIKKKKCVAKSKEFIVKIK